MSSMSGYITYIEYQYGVSKGGINAGERISSPFGFDTPETDYAAKAEYTGARVVEDEAVDATAAAAHKITVTPAWNPKTVDSRHDNPKRQAEANSVVSIQTVKIGSTVYALVDAGSEVADTSCSVADKNDGTFEITFASADTLFVDGATVKYGYVYDNIVIPQDKIPSVRAEMKSVALVAKARRIAVYYSQIAAYQA